MKQIIRDLYPKIRLYGQRVILLCYQAYIAGKNFCHQNMAFLIKLSIPFIIIGFGYCSCIYSQHIITKNVRMIFSISEAIRQHYADQPSYWGLNTEYAIKQNIVPKNIIKNNSLNLGGNTTILIGSGVDGSTAMPMAQSFDIILPHLNKAQCISYAESELSDNENLALISLSIVNNSGTYTFEWGGQNSLPIQKYSTKQLCLDKENTIIWSLK